MRSIKPGRGPSAMGVVGGVIAIVVGIGWTIMAYSVTTEAPTAFHLFFPLFGVAFVAIGIANVIYNLVNTTNKNRLSILDITSDSEEPDPLNQLFGSTKAATSKKESTESKLKELEALRSKGLITESEYSSQRQRILNGI